MTDSAAPFSPPGSGVGGEGPGFVPVSLRDVEPELARQLKAAQEPGKPPASWARMSNLVVFCNQLDQAERITAAVPDLTALHPARVLVLLADPSPPTPLPPGERGKGEGEMSPEVRVQAHCGKGPPRVCSEEVTLRAKGPGVNNLPYAVRSLLVGDLPTNLWWASSQPPPLAGPLFHELAEPAQQVVYDSLGWTEPARCVAATAAWLARFEHGPGQGRWRIASDLGWRRLKSWRRIVGQALDPASAPGALGSITEILVEHGPRAVVQAWQLVSWLVSRFGWKAQSVRVQPNVEIAWKAAAGHGTVYLRVRRLAEGPPEVRRLRIACTLEGKPAALNFTVEDEGRRLAVMPEGVAAAPRTLTVPPQPLPELVARQLSDREHDPVFRESMAAAQALAQRILG